MAEPPLAAKRVIEPSGQAVIFRLHGHYGLAAVGQCQIVNLLYIRHIDKHAAGFFTPFVCGTGIHYHQQANAQLAVQNASGRRFGWHNELGSSAKYIFGKHLKANGILQDHVRHDGQVLGWNF